MMTGCALRAQKAEGKADRRFALYAYVRIYIIRTILSSNQGAAIKGCRVFYGGVTAVLPRFAV